MFRSLKQNIHPFDNERDIAVLPDKSAAVDFAVEHFLAIARKSLDDHAYFAVALTGGKTPKEIYNKLATPKTARSLDWSRVLLFWSDERSVPPDHPDSNYRMAMEAGFDKLPIRPKNTFRMEAETDIAANAAKYESLIKENIPSGTFDLVLLGMGQDGHTASLFPDTEELYATDQLVAANYVPKLDTWRMTLTFECINTANKTCIYVLGENKAEILKTVLKSPYEPDKYPIQSVGTPSHHAMWIVDNAAAKLLLDPSSGALPP